MSKSIKYDRFAGEMNSSARLARVFIIVLNVVLSGLTISAQPSAISLFASDTPVEVYIELPMRSLMRSKHDEKEFPATLRIAKTNEDTVTLDIEVRCRGNIRKEVCYYPSLRMKFSKKEFSYNKLKWVNVCDNASDEIFLFKEFLAYKMYNVVADASFRAYLVHIHYVDKEAKEKPLDTYAFVIQNADELAEQYRGRVHEPTILKETVLQPEAVAVFAFFQFMIANTDWAFGNLHNVETITHPETNTVIPVAYDFDYSGFVNASYATPHTSMPITHVTTRYNKCFCLDEEVCERTRLLFLSKKEDVLDCCRTFPFLEGKAKNKAIDFIEDFYKIIEDPKDTQRIFVKDCRDAR